MKPETKTKQKDVKGVYLDKTLLNDIKKIAQEQERTLTNMLSILVKLGYETWKERGQ